MDKKELSVTIDLKLLKRIAEFYDFPLAVFFGNQEVFPKKKKTRNELLDEKARRYDKIKEFVEDLD